MFVNPSAAAHLEWRCPQAHGESVFQNMMGHKPHAVRELRRVGGDILAAGILIALINLEKVVTERVQMLRQPIGVGQRFALIDRGIVSSPTPPPHWDRARNTCMMEASNGRTISAKLP